MPWGAAEAAPHHPPAAPLAVLRIGLNFKFCRAGTSGRGSVINLLRRPRCPCSAAIHPPGIRLPALPAASGCTQDIRKPEAAGLHHLKLPLCRKDVPACVEINQCDGCTKSFLGDDAPVLALSSGEEPASPRHRAGVASMAWRTFDFHAARRGAPVPLHQLQRRPCKNVAGGAAVEDFRAFSSFLGQCSTRVRRSARIHGFQKTGKVLRYDRRVVVGHENI